MSVYNTSYRLKQIMTERNLRQVDILNLAKPYCEKYKIRLGRNDLSQYVSGKVEPNQYKLYVLGKALNVSEAWLMGFDVPMERNNTAVEAPAKKITKIYSQILKEMEHKLRELLDDFPKLRITEYGLDTAQETVQRLADWRSYIPDEFKSVSLPDSDEYNCDICTDIDKETINLYMELDTEDKAEIRGEIKGMLKADKYS